jgi:hypothetical protein
MENDPQITQKEETVMKLARIKIEKLFGQFDYDIKLNANSARIYPLPGTFFT